MAAFIKAVVLLLVACCAGRRCVAAERVGVIASDALGNVHINASVPGARVLMSGVDAASRVQELEQANAALQAEQAALLERQASLQSTLSGLADAHLELVHQYTTLAERFTSLIDHNRNSLDSPISSSDLDLVFTRQFGATEATWIMDMAVTDGGSVFICGHYSGRFAGMGALASNKQLFLARLSSVDGRILWAIKPSSTPYRVARKVTADRSGRVFLLVAGNGSRVLCAHRVWDGAKLWETQIDVPLIPTGLTALRDEATVVVAASVLTSPDNRTTVVQAFDTASGAGQWSTILPRVEDNISVFSDAEPTPDGDVIVYESLTSIGSVNGRRMLHRLRGHNGTIVWSRALSAASVVPNTLAIGPSDRGCVGKLIDVGSTTQEFIVSCFSLEDSGFLTSAIAIGVFAPSGMAVVGNGDVIIAGRAANNFTDLPARGGTDMIVLRLSETGIVWSDRLGGPDDERAVAIHADASGNVFVTGHGQVSPDPNSGEGDGFLVKYAQAPPAPPVPPV